MKYARVTISIPEGLLSEVDELAAQTGVSRSFLVQEASAHYLSEKHETEAAEDRRRSIQEAIEGFDRIRKMPVLDARPTIELLRELREHDGFVDE